MKYCCSTRSWSPAIPTHSSSHQSSVLPQQPRSSKDTTDTKGLGIVATWLRPRFSSTIILSILLWSVTSMPRSLGPRMSLTFATAFSTPCFKIRTEQSTDKRMGFLWVSLRCTKQTKSKAPFPNKRPLSPSRSSNAS